MGEWAKWAKVVGISHSVYRGVFDSSILFYEKYERNRWFTLRRSEIVIHSAHLEHSPIYAKMGARAWAAMYLDRGCTAMTFFYRKNSPPPPPIRNITINLNLDAMSYREVHFVQCSQMGQIITQHPHGSHRIPLKTKWKMQKNNFNGEFLMKTNKKNLK